MAYPSSSSPRVLKVGIIGCGEVSQVIHIPALLFLRDKFQITYLCDVSPSGLQHCAAGIPTAAPSPSLRTTRDPAELCGSPNVDAVLVASSDEYHADHAVAALRAGKHVLVEKPLALCRRDVERIIAAEEEALLGAGSGGGDGGGGGGRVMVGYMRRYAAVFEDAVSEIGGMDKIVYARVRGMSFSVLVCLTLGREPGELAAVSGLSNCWLLRKTKQLLGIYRSQYLLSIDGKHRHHRPELDFCLAICHLSSKVFRLLGRGHRRQDSTRERASSHRAPRRVWCTRD